jgi:hypothetical protein
MNTITITHTVIPALPDWNVLIYIGGEESCFVTEPVIAWEIERCESKGDRKYDDTITYETWPITIQGSMHDHSNQRAVKRPDGTVQIIGEGRYDGEAEALAVCRDIEAADARIAASFAAAKGSANGTPDPPIPFSPSTSSDVTLARRGGDAGP